ncbi:MAG TPA: TonB-dependent receptor [Rhizomicrobium sp.]|nr:TonB-dependent receptor [Rhizomicrobium sp.]
MYREKNLRLRLLAGISLLATTSAWHAAGAQSATPDQPAQPSETQVAQASRPSPRKAGEIETVVVSAQKKTEDLQSVPIAISAFSAQDLTDRQIAVGPDLVKNVPNLTFTKTNFTGYDIQIRGIGTQAISVTTDPAVAVSFNNIPFLRNHFFEQEFFDVNDVEVLRGPQGTLYGRNAPAGVINVISAKPTDEYAALGSVDVGNYNSRRLEAMGNFPVWGDKIDLRVAGEWTKRDGYSFNDLTDHSVDGRDLWSSRVSLLIHPTSHLTGTFIWEHFQESDDRLRSGKQLCQRDNGPSVVNGPDGPQIPDATTNLGAYWLSQGCGPGSLYSPSSFGTPNAGALPSIAALYAFTSYVAPFADPYAGVTQSPNLRVINSQIDPRYSAHSDTYEFNLDYALTPELTLSSQTGYNRDSLYSAEDYDRFNTNPGFFVDPGGQTLVGQDGQFCDPQLGCSSRLVSEDVSQESAHQFYQEVRLHSDSKDPLNFVIGANYLKYATVEDYYLLSNSLTLAAESFNSIFGGVAPPDAPHIPFDAVQANSCGPQPASEALLQSSFLGLGCSYIDPNPLSKINGQGHNYFRSENPYKLTSWAVFGETYYQFAPELQLTTGLRFTDDKKDFTVIPSWALDIGEGLPVAGVIRQEWQEVTGRANLTWTPKTDFTDDTMVYASFAHGYKGGGANPPGVEPVPSGNEFVTSPGDLTHPPTFKPEFNNAFEIGTKNRLFGDTLTLNGDIFFYKYQNYQISQIVDRTSVNLNFNATVRGAELTSEWTPIDGLRLSFNGGYENATADSGQSAIDLMDRTAGTPGWMVVKPFISQTSNCILPTYVVNVLMANNGLPLACLSAYASNLDPVTQSPYVPNPAGYPGYAGFNPATAPNNGDGFLKNVGGNQLPNTPHYTTSLSADYTLPFSSDWAATLHGDFYWQSQSWSRIFNDRPYDKLRGFSNVNLALILSNSDNWQVMAYVKNLFDTTAITGAFLNSDDTGLTTNVFTTDPRLFGLRVTKKF